MISGTRSFLVLALGAALVAAGCGGELTTREKGTLGGAALGAATGAIIGAAVGAPGTGAAIGAGLGALGGTLVGSALQDQERKAESQPRQTPAPPPSSHSAPPPPPPKQARLTASGDPTRGQFQNTTRWRVHVYVDQDPSRPPQAPFLALNPGDVIPQNLGIGTRRIVAQAFVETQSGARPVGWFERSIRVDPRGSGWTLRFSENDFR